MPNLYEWAVNITSGKTTRPTGAELIPDPFEQARYTGPPVRVKRAMIAYAKSRNKFRWKRLQSDFAWLKATMIEMEMNPEDARFLL